MKRILLTASLVALTAVPALAARDQIRIVGSSTVYPFTTAVAEQFGKTSGMKTPVVEATGTGGGLKLFCAGLGEDKPDFANASRPIKKAEFETCVKNGVTEIVELEIGFDGLSVAQSKDAKPLSLTKEQLFRALAKNIPDKDGKLIPNPNKTWKDVDASLPDVKIEVLGPPPTSGTRDSFAELALEAGALKIPAMADLKKSDAKAFEAVWKSIREDGAYVEAGENDNLIVQKLVANPAALGIFGFSFVEQNANAIVDIPIDGVQATYETIADGSYKLSRPLFIYAKNQHVGKIPGIVEFIAEYVSDKAIGPDGYLAAKGLVTLPGAEADKTRAVAKNMTVLTAADVK
ncbi:PstS family phosphate ABC transporter substrate-binding protein [Aestuariivirga sp.]|uniref:PstS family phosphate ABC transporter substrate-binding protein n=1 Tax=Aestuariivirga sp. TaxID=2650926 RepID=UPI0025C4CAC5|nr:PstS family phosphate ABC transporter substrate-binding protein [Aestuariivirga sp.]MCA3553993.1 PstS family phosphate ABC transporter substrate-binding protein [Aestuariivirga sp.]